VISNSGKLALGKQHNKLKQKRKREIRKKETTEPVALTYSTSVRGWRRGGWDRTKRTKTKQYTRHIFYM